MPETKIKLEPSGGPPQFPLFVPNNKSYHHHPAGLINHHTTIYQKTEYPGYQLPSSSPTSIGNTINNPRLSPEEFTDYSSKSTRLTSDEPELNTFVVIMRGLLSNREAGVVIGKSGLTMDELRVQTGAKIAISKPDSSLSDRVITVGGSHSEVAGAYSLIAKCLSLNCLTNQFQVGNSTRKLTLNHSVIRILVAHSLIGILIGKQGINIRSVEEISGTRIIALKSILPYSTERVVEIQGSTTAIETAVLELALRIGREWDRALSIIHYVPRDMFCTNVLEKVLQSRDPTHPLPGTELNVNPQVPDLIYVRHLPISLGEEKLLAGFCLNHTSNRLSLTIQQDASGTRNLVMEGSRNSTYHFLRAIESKLADLSLDDPQPAC